MWSDSQNDHASRTFTGNVAVDVHHQKIGTVTDVLYDERNEVPRWAVVKMGALRGERLMPLADSYVTEDGKVVVALEKNSVKHAPRARRDHVLTIDLRRQLRDYYNIAA
jgi:hypothetical protein